MSFQSADPVEEESIRTTYAGVKHCIAALEHQLQSLQDAGIIQKLCAASIKIFLSH